ncbi:hypothetical protein IV203_011788 [Nitzschia inconspicua]|uniref:Uncharacterized protein n=1 Tax=Nitzschia inconspicua TaxID=303405 RepID=A0A9K3KT63_9STRA|nr:hypothetical protein IV203_011788 [Nitzschia inconspicua]
MNTTATRPFLSIPLLGNNRPTLTSSQAMLRRISSSTTRWQAKRENLPPPLPPSSSKPPPPQQQPLDPLKAKQRYLESKRRTEEFLQDPQKKITQLQTEMNQVKERLDKEVYNKSVWRRLTDPLRRKQHSLINMIAATFAYVLAFQLHLKRQANQKLQEELEEQAQTTVALKKLLRSLLEDGYLQEMAEAASDEMAMIRSNTRSSVWPWSSTEQSSSSASQQLSPEQVVQILRSKLEERIGDEGLDDDAKKERNIERIWKENQEKLESDDNGDDNMSDLIALALESEEEESSTSDRRKRRVFDM